MARKTGKGTPAPEPVEDAAAETNTVSGDMNVVGFLVGLTTFALLAAIILMELALKQYGAGMLA